MSNPFDQLELARDLVRRDECQHLFDKVRKEHKRIEEQYGLNIPDMEMGYMEGLDFVMNELDERIGWLRDRWG